MLDIIEMDLTSDKNFTIIVPTYKEVKNIPALLATIADIDFDQRLFEVLLMDDNSQDGTAALIAQISQQYPWVKLIQRNKQRDLSKSIIEGINLAQYPIIITLDADLSHPINKLPEMLAALEEPTVDIVIGSRYIPGGSTDQTWPAHRKFISWTAALLARLLLLSPVKDPLSGFLAIRKKTVLEGDSLKPIGWKIGLEIIIKCHCRHIKEIPIHFDSRRHGKSKLNLTISLQYFLHLIALLRYKMIF